MKSCVEHGLERADGCMACASVHEPGVDWKDVSISLAATNERACRVILSADELATETERLLEAVKRDFDHTGWRLKLVQKALDAYKITRSGT